MVYLRCKAGRTKTTCAERDGTSGTLSHCSGIFQKWHLDQGFRLVMSQRLCFSKWKQGSPSGLKNRRSTEEREDTRQLHISCKLTHPFSIHLYIELSPMSSWGWNFVQSNDMLLVSSLSYWVIVWERWRRAILSAGRCCWVGAFNGCNTLRTFTSSLIKAIEVLLCALVSIIYCDDCMFGLH